MSSRSAATHKLYAAETVWTFWDGIPPDLVLKCIESMRIYSPSRPVVVVSKATLPLFLSPEDYPTFHGRQGEPDDFSCPQYLSDWVRLTLLEKYGGVWMDASTLCTNSVDSWATFPKASLSKISMFPMHANPRIHANWAMAVNKPGHPLIKAWRAEMCAVFDQTGPGEVPSCYIEQAFINHPALIDIWFNETPPPLPYLWVYLALQVVLQKQAGLHETINLLSSTGGPMYRRYLLNIKHGITDSEDLSRATAQHLATKPLSTNSYDRYFIKLVGMDRAPCQKLMNAGHFAPGSALDFVSQIPARHVTYGCDLQQVDEAKASFRSAVIAIDAANYMLRAHTRRSHSLRRSSVASAA